MNGLAGAEVGVGDLHSPGTYAYERGRSEAAGHQGSRGEAGRAVADVDGQWLAKGKVKVKGVEAGRSAASRIAR